MLDRKTSLSANLIHFCRYLRLHDFIIGIQEEQDALASLQMLSAVNTYEDFQLALRAVLCKTHKQVQEFSGHFNSYWKDIQKALDSKLKDKQEEKPVQKEQVSTAQYIHELKSWLYGNNQDEEIETATYSNQNVQSTTSLIELQARDLAEINRWIKVMIQRIANKRSRRYTTTHRKDKIDLQYSLRKNILQYDEMIQLMQKTKKKNQLKVVLICDVSRSMELYSRFFLQFMYAFQTAFSRIHSFVFSTELYSISSELNHNDINQSVEQVLHKVKHWSGGTRISESLQTFVEDYAQKHVDRKTLVFILSDGWDHGDAATMAESMQKLQRKSMRLIWLNPLAANPNWKPETNCLVAAKPYIDEFLPFNNINDLKSMVKRI